MGVVVLAILPVHRGGVVVVEGAEGEGEEAVLALVDHRARKIYSRCILRLKTSLSNSYRKG